LIDVRPEVAKALDLGVAVVALESTVIAHGLPSPRNLEAAERMEAAVREEGAVPAMVAVFRGSVVIGVSAKEVASLAEGAGIAKATTRDLAALTASGLAGATTVAATAFAAGRAGIDVMATGGIGGVHRGGERSMDISADLAEIGRTPVAVVCSGAKAVLDLSLTLEALETLGVPVVGYGTGSFPAFYARSSGFGLEHRVDSPVAAAGLIARQRRLGMPGGVLFCNPPPAESALDPAEVETLVEAAIRAAEEKGLRGKEVTPFLLDQLATESAGRTLAVNLALLEDNARVAARIAAACASSMA
jgi:pseudouridine-5'-phosphate glycosidase